MSHLQLHFGLHVKQWMLELCCVLFDLRLAVYVNVCSLLLKEVTFLCTFIVILLFGKYWSESLHAS